MTRRARRNRLAYLARLRRISEYSRQAAIERGLAVLVSIVAACFSSHLGPALGLTLIAAIGPLLNGWQTWHAYRGEPEQPGLGDAYLDHIENVSGRPLLNIPAYAELAGMVALVASAAWVLTDVPPLVRIAALAAGVGYWISTALAIFNDHAWFNPSETAPRWQEVLRTFGGVVSAGLVTLIVLPASWSAEEWVAVVLLCLWPLVINARVAENDLTIAHVADLVREQAHEGRELVLRETHGALSTQLRLIVQFARQHRTEVPQLYDLAVGADSRLRETLALAEEDRDTSTTPNTLAAPVMTLSRAVGASTTVAIDVDELSPANHDLARLVLADLVGNALNAGAGTIHVRLHRSADYLIASVTDDARPMAEGAWQGPGTSSARMAERLQGLSGSLEANEDGDSKTVSARWRTSDCDRSHFHA